MEAKSIFEKNKEFLDSMFPGIGEKLEELQIEEDSNICEYRTHDGEYGLYIRNHGGVIQLNSQYASKLYAQIWADHVIEKENFKREHILVLFGFGNGSYVKALVEKMPEDTKIICYEPSEQVFSMAVRNIDLKEILKEKAVLFAEGLNMGYWNTYWKAFVNISNGSLIHGVTLPVYSGIFPEEIQNLICRIQEQNRLIQVAWNTKTRFADSFSKNQIALIPYLLKSHNLEELMKRLPDQYPAIVVAAGPSLKKNIKEIKKAKGKALIIAIDTSVKLLLKEGIVPDIYVTIDAQKPLELFEDDRINDIPVCICPYSVRKSFESNRNKIFISLGDTYIGRFCQKNNKPLGFLGTGGTVAQDAFSLALGAKMSPIILVGQDLAYTDDETHAKGAYQEQVKVEDLKEGEYIWTEDIYGNPVKTIENLMIYKRWYENLLASESMKNIRVIDATEGGAKIEGTEIMSLKDAIEQECTKSFDYERQIAEVSDLFSEEEQKCFAEEFNNLPDIFHRIQKMSCEGTELYERLLMLSQRKGMDVKEIKQHMKKLGNLTEKIEGYLEYLLIEPYVERAAEKALNHLHVEMDNVENDLEEVANRGLIMMEAIQKAVPELLPEVEEMLGTLRRIIC